MDATTLGLVGIAVLVLLAALMSRGGSTKQLERRLDRLEGKLDLLMQHQGVQLPGPDFDQDVVNLARSGRKIEAIKRYRELTGAGLKEAKDAVERIQQ
ncbi:ribosomal protein L7/L12 [Kutzneria chonburiensis]|uniref:Ribosomal protein L7/L12 n=1 Tax=Kutzneria chonburiensis TaxID=1483604 RepID=A0ABV6N0E3_9PSEU|nr:ribosomal protein L7/L12 [Kutzneria chonburiensis]